MVGVVAAGHPESARAGARVLAAGGNAVDAACAASCAAAVAEGPLTGPGAGGFLLARSAEGEVTLLDFFVEAPGLGPDGRRLDPAALDSFSVPFGGADQVFHIGPAAVAVPGMLFGLAEAITTLGRLGRAEVVAPACRLARDGVVVTPQVEYLFDILGPMLTFTPAAARIYAPAGRLVRAGDRVTMPDLAVTFEVFADQGSDAMAHGPLGRAILEHLGERTILTADDLAAYRVIRRDPLAIDHGDVEVMTNAPPSAGGILILAALAAIEPDAVTDEIGFYRGVARATQTANALRDERFIEGLRDPAFVAELVGRTCCKPTGTTNVSVIDADGGMACLSSSCGSGGGVVVPGTGILLNNMLGEEDLNPHGFGLIPAGERMTSMMAPTIAVRDGHPALVLGSAGSNRLRSAILQSLVSVVDCGLDVRSAVDRPRLHLQGDVLDVEGGVSDAVCAALAADGHALNRWASANLYFGGVSAVTSGKAGLAGAADPRRGGGAAAVTDAGEVITL